MAFAGGSGSPGGTHDGRAQKEFSREDFIYLEHMFLEGKSWLSLQRGEDPPETPEQTARMGEVFARGATGLSPGRKETIPEVVEQVEQIEQIEQIEQVEQIEQIEQVEQVERRYITRIDGFLRRDSKTLAVREMKE